MEKNLRTTIRFKDADDNQQRIILAPKEEAYISAHPDGDGVNIEIFKESPHGVPDERRFDRCAVVVIKGAEL